MAKVSRTYVSYRVGDTLKSVTIVIFYSSSIGFYVAVPDTHKAQADLCDDTIFMEYGVIKHHPKKYHPSYNLLVVAATESNVKEKAKQFLRFLDNAQVKQREVICVFWSYKDAFSSLSGNNKGNSQHKPVSLRMALAYCIEKVIPGVKDPVYIYQEGFGYGTMSSSYHDFTVIEDTPEARQVLEYTYGKLFALQEKLTDYLSSQDKVNELVTKISQKLKINRIILNKNRMHTIRGPTE